MQCQNIIHDIYPARVIDKHFILHCHWEKRVLWQFNMIMPTRRLQAKRLFSIIFLLIQKGSWKFIVRRLETRFVLKSLYSCKTRRKQKKIWYSLFHFLKLILFAVVCEWTWLEIIGFWNFVLDFDENSFESYKNDWLNFFTHFDLFFVVNLFAWIEKRLKFFLTTFWSKIQIHIKLLSSYCS